MRQVVSPPTNASLEHSSVSRCKQCESGEKRHKARGKSSLEAVSLVGKNSRDSPAAMKAPRTNSTPSFIVNKYPDEKADETEQISKRNRI